MTTPSSEDSGCLQCGDAYEPSEDGWQFCSVTCEERYEDDHVEEL